LPVSRASSKSCLGASIADSMTTSSPPARHPQQS
jgi:hypothetical protein